MGGDERGITFLELAQILLAPQVAHVERALAESSERPAHIDATRKRIAVHRAEHPVAVRHRARPDVGRIVVVDAAGLAAERILVDGDDLVVFQQTQREGVHLREVVAQEKRRVQQAPERHVRILLVLREVGRMSAARR